MKVAIVGCVLVALITIGCNKKPSPEQLCGSVYDKFVDCVPVLLAHREVPLAVAIHAGWRGLLLAGGRGRAECAHPHWRQRAERPLRLLRAQRAIRGRRFQLRWHGAAGTDGPLDRRDAHRGFHQRAHGAGRQD